MKVFLFSFNPATSPYPVYPLGMAVIAAALTRAGHEVRQFDLLAHGLSLDALREQVRAFAPGLVGVSIRNIDNTNASHEIRFIDGLGAAVRAVRAASGAPVVLGGSGFSILPREIMAMTGADYGVAGEGERLVVELADKLARGEKPADPLLGSAGTWLDGTGMAPPAYDPAILRYYAENGGVTPLQTKRGCPHRCVYCTYPVLEGRLVRPRSPADVVADIRRLRDMGARQIFFTDSIFNDAAGEFRNLVAEMRRQGLNVPWTGFFRPGGLDEADLLAMKETGLNAVELGSDAASDATLQALGKEFTFADIEAAHARCLAAGLSVSHYFMMGGPGETPETVETGIANILRLKGAASFVFLGIRVLPGTPLAARAVREGVVPAGADLLQSVYYFSPGVKRDWLHERLTEAFGDRRDVIYPPDRLDAGLAFLHRLGYSGSMVDMLVKQGERLARRGSGR